MKKLIVILLVLLMLAGCSSKNGDTKISDGDNVIWKTSKETYTNQDLYEDMKENDYNVVLSNYLLKTMAEEDGLDLDEKIKELDEGFDYYIELFGEETTMAYFGSKENYIASYIPTIVAELYMEKEVENNFDSYVSTAHPYKAQIIYVDSLEAVNEIKDAVASKSNTFAYAASEAGYDKEVLSLVYTDHSDLPVEVKEVALNADKPGLYEAFVTTYATDASGNTSEDNRYYLINIESLDVNDFRSDFIDEIVTNVLDSTSMVDEVIANHNVKMHDQKSYDCLINYYGGIK